MRSPYCSKMDHNQREKRREKRLATVPKKALPLLFHLIIEYTPPTNPLTDRNKAMISESSIHQKVKGPDRPKIRIKKIDTMNAALPDPARTGYFSADNTFKTAATTGPIVLNSEVL